MPLTQGELLGFLKFELKFLQEGGYRRSPHAPWKPTRMLQDSPSCLNFNQPSRPHACNNCWLASFVPEERQSEDIPCWYIPLTPLGETIEYYSRCGTQAEMESALTSWIQGTIEKLEGSDPKLACDEGEEEIRKTGT